MNREEKASEMNKEVERRIKGMMNMEGLNPGTFGFMIGKTLILNDISKRYGINFTFRENEDTRLRERIKAKLVDLLLKSGITKGYRVLLILSKLVKLPRAIFPRWILMFDGLKLQMDDGDTRMRHILRDYKIISKREGVWEVNTTKLIKDKIKKGMVCLDIGASIGIFTLQFSRLVGETGKVYSFEPTEMNFNYMCDNIVLNGFEDRTMPFKMAAWNKKELVRMPKCSDKPVWVNGVGVGEFLLDNFGVKKVDFIKVDVDGPEPDVLEGLIPVFENNPQVEMIVEYYPKYIKDAGCDPEKFMRILNKYFTYEVIPDDYSHGCWNYYCKRRQ